ncbi:MAG: GTPase [Akkermansia sp.]
MIKIALIGEFQDGKSTLLNALFGQKLQEIGYGLPETEQAITYSFNESVKIMDTPGFNSSREGDEDITLQAVQEVSLFFLVLCNRQITSETISLLRQAGGETKPFLPILNDKDNDNATNIAQESIASLHNAGLSPLLFGKNMPIINAKRWMQKKKSTSDLGIRQLIYLLTPDSQNISPAERICRLHQACNQWF